MTEEQKRRAMLAFFVCHSSRPSCELRFQPTIEGIAPVEHERLFEFLRRVGCVNGQVHSFLDSTNMIMGNVTSKGLEMHDSNLPFDPTPIQMQTFNISHSTNVAAGNHNTVHQTVYQSVQALVAQIDNSNATPAEKEEAKGLLCKFLEHPLVAAVAGGAVGLLR